MSEINKDSLIKLKRFVQLSCEFSIEKSQVFETNSVFLELTENQEENTAESYEKIMQKKIERAYKFEEYKKLQHFLYLSDELNF